MNLTKLRFVLISILIMFNVLFIKLYYDGVQNKDNISHEEISDTVDILKSFGVSVNKDIINTSRKSYPICRYNPELFKLDDVNNNKKVFENTASLIMYFSNIVKGKSEIVLNCFNIPGGNSISIECDGERLAYASFTESNNFVYTYGERAIPIDENILNSTFTQGTVKYSTKKAVKKFLNGFSSDSDMQYEFIGLEETENGCYVRISEKCNNLNINGAVLTLFEQGGIITAASGNWYFGSFVNAYSEKQVDGVNILFSDEVLKSDEIIAQELVYNIFNIDEFGAYFVPSWKMEIKLDDTTGIVEYDAITGNLYGSRFNVNQ